MMINAAPLAGIFGCDGVTLSADEMAFFPDINPLGLILFRRNCESRDQLKRLTDSFREAVGRADAPILIDEEGGRVQRLQPPEWVAHPAARELGVVAEKNLERGVRAAYINAQLIAHELVQLGINVDAAPVLDLLVDGANEVIGSRAFSKNPELVAAMGRAACEGFLSAGVLPIIKHMPGHGRANADSHIALPTIDVDGDTLLATDMVPFRRLNDMPWAMTAHIVYPQLDAERPCTQSPALIGHWLRERIGFGGVIITDCIHMNALEGTHAERAARSVAAGVDLVLNSHGPVSDMYEVAKVLPVLEGVAKQRVERSLQMIQKGEELDVQMLMKERGELLKAGR